MNELFDADGAIEQLEECQEIIFDYSIVMKDADYLRVCNNLQFVFLEIHQMKRAFHGQSSLLRDIIQSRRRYLRTDISSGDCMIFLLNVIKGIMWLYSFFVLMLTFYLIVYYHHIKQEEKIITSSPEFQRYLKTFPSPN